MAFITVRSAVCIYLAAVPPQLAWCGLAPGVGLRRSAAVCQGAPLCESLCLPSELRQGPRVWLGSRRHSQLALTFNPTQAAVPLQVPLFFFKEVSTWAAVTSGNLSILGETRRCHVSPPLFHLPVLFREVEPQQRDAMNRFFSSFDRMTRDT